jgi:flavorubredoxin
MESAATQVPAVELHPGRLHRLGGAVERDGRLSWVAPEATGSEPMNCYLLTGERGALLIDTGAGMHRDQVLEQLAALREPGSQLSILLTRTELDCPLNVPAIEEAYAVDYVRFTGGVTVPRGVEKACVERFNVADHKTITLEAAPGIELEICTPRLKLLPTLWPYDPVSRTLFTSDSFVYEGWDAPAGDVLLTDEDGPDPAAVRASVLAKFFYFSRADTAPIAADLRTIFERWDVETIAPTHGRVISGRDAVARHVEVLERVLREVGR